MRISLVSVGLALLLCLVIDSGSHGQEKSRPSLQADLHARLETEINRVAEGLHGVMGFAVKDLTGGESFFRNADLVFPTASSIKLAVLLELLRQDQELKLSLDEKHTIRRSDLPSGDTDPILGMLGDGTATMSLRDIATLMVVLSDNGATNILIERTGMENINAGIVRLGLTQTRLRRKMIDIEAARKGRENVSTPRELAVLLERIRGGSVLDAAHTKEFFSLIGLPKESLFNKALPATVRIEDKPGSLDGVRCDAGIIEIPGHPLVMCVMTTYLEKNEDGERAVREVARLVYDHFERLSRSSPYGRLISEK